MKDMTFPRVSSRRIRCTLAVGLGCLLLAPSSRAFQFADGDLTGSFDSTFSFGGLYRLSNPSPEFYGTTNSFHGVAGQQNSVNADDGDLNYGKGWVSELFKGSHDLELKYHDYGFFARGYYFSDLEADNTLRTPLSSLAKERVTNGAELLDLYVVGKFEAVNDLPLDIRFGRQVLSLGESTFIPNGVNVINPIDLSKLRAPGAELKEAFLPVNMLKVSIGLTKNITFEPFWLLEFRPNELEPAGTYFSTNDFASPGGRNVYLGFGTLPDNGTLGAIPRAADHTGNNYDQFGASLRVLAPGLNDTEFGFYFARYHSRSPVISAITPTAPIDSSLVVATATSLATTNLVPVMIANGYPPAGIPSALNTLIGAALTGVPAAALPPSLQPFYPAAQSIAAGAGKIGLLTAAAAGRYFDEYPEAI